MIDVRDTAVAVHEADLRIPFSFGVTTLTELPQAFVRGRVTVDGTTVTGVAADNLVPRWFSKDPDATPAEDVAALEAVVDAARREAAAMDPADTVFDYWLTLHDRVAESPAAEAHPPLVWGFGVSMLERVAIDAFCRATGTTFDEAVRANGLGVRPGAVYGELDGVDPAAGLPERPRDGVAVRHTVGAEDPLTTADVTEGAAPEDGGPVDDGLPHVLTQVVDDYGVSHFKVKVKGDPAADRERVRRVVDVVESRVADPVYTLDANETYESPARLEEFWSAVRTAEDLAGFREGLAFVEQPFPREVAFEPWVGEALDSWDGPPVIVDESDDRPDALGTALERGYAGTSHKNCKGVLKSVVNACLLATRSRETDREFVHSAEDLTTTGPVALPQDLAVVATLGIGHVERNGHHYLRGLESFPAAVQEAALEGAPALYEAHPAGYPTLAVTDGTLDLADVRAAPFGVADHPERALFE